MGHMESQKHLKTLNPVNYTECKKKLYPGNLPKSRAKTA